MLFSESAGVLAISALLDYSLGDPKGWLHPVQVMGQLIHIYSQMVFRWLKHPLGLRLAGIGLGLGLVSLSAGIGWTLIVLMNQLHPIAGIFTQGILLAACFAGRSLRDAALDVLQPLQAGNLPQARAVLSQYVGRDTADLSEAEILRAVLETVTENATDGVLAPLFYGLLGSCLPGIGSAPLALAYKAASTLDSMVGYRTPPYAELGWFSARMDDVLTWLPCRCVVLTIGLLSGHPLAVWRLCQRDAPTDPSPNSGWSECVYAATLGVQVGGTNYYQGVPRLKPPLGNPIEPIAPKHIHRALLLTRSCFLLWLLPMIGVLSWLHQ